MEEAVAGVVTETASAAMQVAQTPKRAVSLATKPRSLPSQEAETQVTALLLGRVLLAALPPCRAAGLGRRVFGVWPPAAPGSDQGLRFGDTAGPPARGLSARAAPLA